MTAATHVWLKMKIYFKKVTAMTNLIFIWTVGFINVYTFRNVNFVVISHLHTMIITCNSSYGKGINNKDFGRELVLFVAFIFSSSYAIINFSRTCFGQVQLFKYSSILHFLSHSQVHMLGFHT